MAHIKLYGNKYEFNNEVGGVDMSVTEAQLKKLKEMAYYNNMYLIIEYDYMEEQENGSKKA